jgi:ElaB/YqjD/DUF883 family membrane-anchored ribosome-binding protein
MNAYTNLIEVAEEAATLLDHLTAEGNDEDRAINQRLHDAIDQARKDAGMTQEG